MQRPEARVEIGAACHGIGSGSCCIPRYVCVGPSAACKTHAGVEAVATAPKQRSAPRCAGAVAHATALIAPLLDCTRCIVWGICLALGAFGEIVLELLILGCLIVFPKSGF